MGIFDFLVLALATFRVANLFSAEDGPGKIFRRIRIFAGTEDRDATGHPKHLAGQLLDCPLCCSIWVAVGLYLIYSFFPWTWPAMIVLAMSGAACLAYLWTKK